VGAKEVTPYFQTLLQYLSGETHEDVGKLKDTWTPGYNADRRGNWHFLSVSNQYLDFN
jgi:hypothetical protein